MTTPTTGPTNWPDDNTETTTNETNGAADEPFIDVPAGLLGQAVELLAVFDQLVEQTPGTCIGTQLRALLRDSAPQTPASLPRLRTTLRDTGHDLAEILADTGIWVEPTLSRHHTLWRRR